VSRLSDGPEVFECACCEQPLTGGFVRLWPPTNIRVCYDCIDWMKSQVISTSNDHVALFRSSATNLFQHLGSDRLRQHLGMGPRGGDDGRGVVDPHSKVGHWQQAQHSDTHSGTLPEPILGRTCAVLLVLRCWRSNSVVRPVIGVVSSALNRP
jgi:hypothetical protein